MVSGKIAKSIAAGATAIAIGGASARDRQRGRPGSPDDSWRRPIHRRFHPLHIAASYLSCPDEVTVHSG